MVRADLVEGAVTFLQDPSVSSAPIEQKRAFLRSKNLTQEEIDASLARAGGQPAPPSQSSQQTYPLPPSQYSNNGYAHQQWQPWQQPPPVLPRRDWRDWFIMATVLGGVGYAAYWTAKRYLYPLIAPPTPPQLEQDKLRIDQSFDKAFALLDQLAKDTSELKASEQARKERLDEALADLESVIERLRETNEKREREARGMARDLDEVREVIPKVIEREKRTTDEKLEGLTQEMKSLRTLAANRMQLPAPQQPSPHTIGAMQDQSQRPIPQSYGSQPAASHVNGNGGHAPPPSVPQTNGATSPADGSADTEKPSVLPDRSNAPSPYDRLLGGGNKAQIPSWQLAAKKRSDEAQAKKDAGTRTETGSASSKVEDVAESS